MLDVATFHRTEKLPHVQYVTNVVTAIATSNIITSVILFCYAIVATIIDPIVLTYPSINTLLVFPPLYFAINVWVLRRIAQGKRQHGETILTASGFVLICIAIYLTGGLSSPAMIGLVVIFITGIVLVNFKIARRFYGAIVAYFMVLIGVELTDILPEVQQLNVWVHLLALFIGFAAILLIVSYHRYALLESGRRTARLEAEAERFRTQSELTQNLAHDLRTPISIVKSKISLVKKRQERGLPIDDKLHELDGAVDRMHQMIEDLLKFSILDVATMTLVDMRRLVLHCIDSVQPYAAENNIALECEINPQQAIFTTGNEKQLAQVIDNLLENAIHYGNSRISVTLWVDQEIVSIAIQDDGIGIAPEHHDKIFNRFFRVDAARTVSDRQGMGIGLSIVQRVIQLYKGTITVESALGQGSTFTIQLPLIDSSTIRDDAPQKSADLSG